MPFTCYKAAWAISWPRNWRGGKVHWLRTPLFPFNRRPCLPKNTGKRLLSVLLSATLTLALFFAGADIFSLISNSLNVDGRSNFTAQTLGSLRRLRSSVCGKTGNLMVGGKIFKRKVLCLKFTQWEFKQYACIFQSSSNSTRYYTNKSKFTREWRDILSVPFWQTEMVVRLYWKLASGADLGW